MPTLTITLTDGFSGETVAVHLGGKTVLTEGVRTQRLLGFAAEREVEVEAGGVEVEVEATGAPPLRFSVEVGEADLYARVWREGDHLLHSVGEEPPAFL